jgi:hypothetical protein
MKPAPLIVIMLFGLFTSIALDITHAQGPLISQSYGLTLERDDFPPATQGQTVFQTPVSTRSSFAIVYRNGLLQRPCLGATGCDYVPSGNLTVTYPGITIQAGDLITIFYYR